MQVEVNILTGETTVLAADIIYDAGKSLNHLVDIGQVGPSSLNLLLAHTSCNDLTVLSLLNEKVSTILMPLTTLMFNCVCIQVEGAFVFGLGFYLTEEVLRNSKGKVVSDGTWTYKPPTIDIIPQSFNVELYKSPYHNDEIFSSKGQMLKFLIFIINPIRSSLQRYQPILQNSF